MMIKSAVAFTILMLVTVAGNPLKSSKLTSPFEVVSLIHLEEPCVRQGGICLRTEDCEPGNLVTFSAILCPMQRDMGVVCCYL